MPLSCSSFCRVRVWHSGELVTLVVDQQREGTHLEGIEFLEGELLASIHNGTYHNLQPMFRNYSSCLPISKKGLKWARPSSSEPFQKRINTTMGYDISGPEEFELKQC